MMSFYHLTLTQGRSDSLVVEASNFTTLKSVIDSISTANIDSIKEIVYSLQYSINYIDKTAELFEFDKSLNILAKSQNYTRIIQLPFTKKNLSFAQIETSVKKNLLINDEPILEILCMNSEGVARSSDGGE